MGIVYVLPSVGFGLRQLGLSVEDRIVGSDAVQGVPLWGSRGENTAGPVRYDRATPSGEKCGLGARGPAAPQNDGTRGQKDESQDKRAYS